MIYLTEKAEAKAEMLLDLNGFDPLVGGVRLAIKSGGCSGLEYALDLESEPSENDRIFKSENGVRIFCDPKSYLYVRETTIDYKDSMTGGGFSFQNPQAKRSCGCGTSFTT